MKKKKTALQNGYALLFAILVSSILLSAGLGISNIIFKELLLSGIGKQSAIAFFAADSGAECALYWERKFTRTAGGPASLFPLNGAEIGSPPYWSGKNAFCSGVNLVAQMQPYPATVNGITGVGYSAGQTSAKTYLKLQLQSAGGPCALITVEKGGGTTRIESRGFNIPCSDTGNSRRVERALRYRISSS